jgi:hypothetical protein
MKNLVPCAENVVIPQKPVLSGHLRSNPKSILASQLKIKHDVPPRNTLALVFKGPVHRTGKRLQLNQTEPQKTGLSVAVWASRDGRTARNRADKDRF